VIVWRLARLAHVTLDGEGARLAGGRWNSRGRAAVYTSSRLSLAALELLVHTDVPLVPPDLQIGRAHV
jgi:RES domain-containing protein